MEKIRSIVSGEKNVTHEINEKEEPIDAIGSSTGIDLEGKKVFKILILFAQNPRNLILSHPI